MTVRWNVFSRIPEMVKKLLFFGTKIENYRGWRSIYFSDYDHDQWSQSLLNSRWYHRSAIVSLDRWWFYSCLPFVALAPTKWQISTLLRNSSIVQQRKPYITYQITLLITLLKVMIQRLLLFLDIRSQYLFLLVISWDHPTSHNFLLYLSIFRCT